MAKIKKPRKSVPAFTSDRWRLFGPLMTAHVVELARRRIFGKEKFFVGSSLAEHVAREELSTLKAALLVAHEMNPFEVFQCEEQALLHGLNADTLRKRKRDGLSADCRSARLLRT